MGSMQGYYGYSNDQSHTDRQMQDADVIQPGQCMIASMHRQQAILPLPESVTSQAHSVMCVAQCRRSWNAGRYDAGRAGHDEQHVQPAGDGPSATAGTTSHGRQHDGVWSHDATTAGIWKHEPWARCASTPHPARMHKLVRTHSDPSRLCDKACQGMNGRAGLHPHAPHAINCSHTSSLAASLLTHTLPHLLTLSLTYLLTHPGLLCAATRAVLHALVPACCVCSKMRCRSGKQGVQLLSMHRLTHCPILLRCCASKG